WLEPNFLLSRNRHKGPHRRPALIARELPPLIYYLSSTSVLYCGVGVMRLQHYSSFFRPEEFDAMTAAYDAAWQHLQTNRPTLPAYHVRVQKKILAQIILTSASTGKRDV